jgi:hypothetical protein
MSLTMGFGKMMLIDFETTIKSVDTGAVITQPLTCCYPTIRRLSSPTRPPCSTFSITAVPSLAGIAWTIAARSTTGLMNGLADGSFCRNSNQ